MLDLYIKTGTKQITYFDHVISHIRNLFSRKIDIALRMRYCDDRLGVHLIKTRIKGMIYGFVFNWVCPKLRSAIIPHD